MKNNNSITALRTAVHISRTLDMLCTFSTAVTAVTALWAICSTAKKLSR